MSNFKDEIIAHSIKIEARSEHDNRVFYVDSRKKIRRTFRSSLGKTWSKILGNDKYIVVDARNSTCSEGFQNFTVAVDVMRKVAANVYTGPMQPCNLADFEEKLS